MTDPEQFPLIMGDLKGVWKGDGTIAGNKQVSISWTITRDSAATGKVVEKVVVTSAGVAQPETVENTFEIEIVDGKKIKGKYQNDSDAAECTRSEMQYKIAPATTITMKKVDPSPKSTSPDA